MKPNADVRIVIADPVPAARAAFVRLFSATPGWTVAAVAMDSFEAVSVARREHADVLLLSSSAAGLSIQEVRTLLRFSRTLVVSLIERPEQHAVHGSSVLKSLPWDELQCRLQEFLRGHRSARATLDLAMGAGR